MTGYTHLIKFEKNLGDNLWADCFFRATPDTIELHIQVLRRRVAKGDIRKVTIRTIVGESK